MYAKNGLFSAQHDSWYEMVESFRHSSLRCRMQFARKVRNACFCVCPIAFHNHARQTLYYLRYVPQIPFCVTLATQDAAR